MENTVYYSTQLGFIGIKEENGAITGLFYTDKIGNQGIETPLIQETYRQLQAYLEGKRKKFNIPITLKGTVFQKKVWETLQTIPYGETRSYQDIACLVGNPKASRAVGMANHNNPIAIIVPCHRVIGKKGTLVGYAGGLSIKNTLLELEQNELSRN